MIWRIFNRRKQTPEDLWAQVHAISDDVDEWVAPRWKAFLVEMNLFDGQLSLEEMMAGFFGTRYPELLAAFPVLKEFPIEVWVAVGGHGIDKSGTHSFAEVQAAIKSLVAIEEKK